MFIRAIKKEQTYRACFIKELVIISGQSGKFSFDTEMSSRSNCATRQACPSNKMLQINYRDQSENERPRL